MSIPPDFPNRTMYDGLLLPSSTSCPFSSSSSALPPPPPGGVHRHPLEVQQSEHLRLREQLEFRRAASLYGLHAPLRLKMERELTAMTQRLPGLPSSLLGLQTLMRLDEEISVEDYLNVDGPEEKFEGETIGCGGGGFGPGLGVHELIERRMRI